MNLNQLFSQIEQADPEIHDRLDTRRSAMRQFANLGKKLAATAIPVALGAMFKKAYGQAPAGLLEVLNFALTLEYLEAEFYTTALAKTGLIPAGAALGAIQTISTHETQHVAFLRTAITGAGATPVAKPKFDFSGGSGSGTGPFANVFNSYELFLAVAQTLEDTGVRAYKGQAPNLLRTGDVLTAALRIHSVEARHASQIRQMRRAANFSTTIKPWITLNNTEINPDNAVIQAVYNGENNPTQAGLDLRAYRALDNAAVTFVTATEAFDEPLTRAEVLAIAGPFIAR
ncbi:MAG: ferritin-like domain-containing protein [Cytophagaceae bacterium]|nr:ferritin-like domain-containing protein [Cytophagaceae bacterium]